jgi:hypothetical protein
MACQNLGVLCVLNNGPQAAQKVRPARPQRVKTGGVPSGYVEDLNDARTTLAEFFSGLPGAKPS